MHIVYICREYPPSLRMGGIAAYLKEITVAMAKRGHQVTVIAASDDTRKEYEETIDAVRVIRLKGGDFYIPAIENSRNLIKKLRQIYRFSSYRKRVREAVLSLEKVDVIEVAEYGAEGYYLHDIGIPVTMRLHTPTLLDRDSGRMKQFQLSWFHEYWVGMKELKMMKRFKNVTSCSKSLLEWCGNYIPNFTKNGVVIYNPLDTAKWVSPAETNYQDDTVFYAGTVAETKGVGDLITAIAQLNDNGHQISLTIAGKLGQYGKDLKLMRNEKSYDWCRFLGHISREELKTYYNNSKVCCFPSWWENLPMVCLEAMAIGNVVVGSRNGGMAEIITDEADGYLIEPKNIQDISSTILKGLSLSRDKVNAMRMNARHRIQSMFSTESIANQFEKYYESISK